MPKHGCAPPISYVGYRTKTVLMGELVDRQFVPEKSGR
jgi:hypothetical protein